MTAFNPKVSIVIPVYNGANYLAEAIDSALAQTYPNCEVLVINDGSTDNGATREVALSYGDRIRYFEKENGGVASALNMGIREMTGEYFSWLSHDDLYYPNKIQRQIEWLEGKAARVILYSDYDIVNNKSEVIATRRIVSSNKHMLLSLIMDEPVNGCTVLVPKECFDEVGGFNESLKTTQDYEFWFRSAQKYDYIHIPDLLIKSRIHESQGTQTISSHRDNENDYFIWAIKQLPVISANTLGVSLDSSFYLKLAINLSSRECQRAADTASAEAFARLCRCGVVSFVSGIIFMVFYFCYLKAKKIDSVRRIVKKMHKVYRNIAPSVLQ